MVGNLTLAVSKAADHFDPPQNQYIRDPVAWAEDTLKAEMWSRQMDLMDSVADNRHTAVKSAHSTGKSWAAATLVAWWLDVHPPGTAFAVTTAPSQAQVEAVLWREIGRAHKRGNLQGRITSGMVPMWKFGDEIVAYGRKPAEKVDSEQAMQAFQGIHAKFILVILDEACGIPSWLWDAADTLATNDDARILAIGNPDDPTSRFAEVFKPGAKNAGWNKMTISAFDTPAFTGEKVSDELRQALVSKTWVEERKQRWGENSMLYTSKVKAMFPDVSADTLITPAMILKAQNANHLPGIDSGRFACDVARFGEDETVIGRNRGGVFRVVKTLPLADTMETAGHVAHQLRKHNLRIPAVIDTIGVGAGVYDRLNEQDLPVVGFTSSEAPSDTKRFANLRAEQWWNVRTAFEDGLVDLDPDDEDTAAELLAIKYKMQSTGKIIILPKEEIRKDIKHSPDRADTLMMSFYEAGEWELPVKADPRVKSNGIMDDVLERPM